MEAGLRFANCRTQNVRRTSYKEARRRSEPPGARRGLRILNISPAIHEPLMGKDAGEFAGDGTVHVFHNLEVGGKQDVEVALLDLPIPIMLA